MTAPQSNGFDKKEKNPNLQPVPFGLHPVICYAVIDLGTQIGNYQGNATKNRKVVFKFEFPFQKQLFYADDTEMKSAVLSAEFNFSIYRDKSNKATKLLAFLEGIFGPLTAEQCKTFDVSQLVGKAFTANVVHKVSSKDNKTYANISGISPFNQALVPAGGQLIQTLPSVVYSLNHGFENAAFASMDWYSRKLVKESVEGSNHIAKGGKFVKLNNNNELVFDDAAVEVQQQPQQGATASQVYQQQAQATSPAQQFAGAAVHVAQAVAPAVPSVSQTPAPAVASAPILVATGAHTLEALRGQGWTDELMVQHGHARWDNPAPTAPSVPVVPTVPVVPVQQAQAVAPVQQAQQANMFTQPVANMASASAVAPAVASAPGVVHNPVQVAPAGFQAGAVSGVKEEHDDLPF